MDLGVAIFLTLLFVSLKLVGSIAWSWWAVLSPLLAWVGLVFVLFFYKLHGKLKEKT